MPLSLVLEHFRVVCHLLEGDFEPLGVMLGIQLDVFLQVLDIHVFPRSDLFGVDAGDVVAPPNPHMVELVLGEALADGGFIYKGIDLVHLATHAHLFPKAA